MAHLPCGQFRRPGGTISPVSAWQAEPCHILRAAWRAHLGLASHPWQLGRAIPSKYFSCPGGEVIRSIRPGAEPEFPNACAAPEGQIRKFPPPRTVRSPQCRSSSPSRTENLFDLGVVVGADVESRRNHKLEQRALFGVFGCDQVIDTSVMQSDPVSLAERLGAGNPAVRFQSAISSKADIART